MEQVRNYIRGELFSFLSSDEKVNDMFETVLWNEVPSIYLRYKNNHKDGFIITTTPYFHEEQICFHITIISVDSCKVPKPFLIKFISINHDSLKKIKDYLTLEMIQV